MIAHLELRKCLEACDGQGHEPRAYVTVACMEERSSSSAYLKYLGGGGSHAYVEKVPGPACGKCAACMDNN